MDLTLKRNQIITIIKRIKSEALLIRLEEYVNTISQQKDIFYTLTLPMKQTLDLEEMIQEQNYKGPNKEKIDQITRDINIEQSTDELLAMI
jgi:hypothetical protein